MFFFWVVKTVFGNVIAPIISDYMFKKKKKMKLDPSTSTRTIVEIPTSVLVDSDNGGNLNF